MRKRKLLKTMAAILFVCVVLVGCGQKQPYALDPKNPVALTIWHYYNGPQKVAFDKFVEQFNSTVGQEKGIIVESFSQGNVTELTEKVVQSAEKKIGSDPIPNIFAAYADTAYQVDQLGMVAELDPYLTEEELGEYVSAYLEEGRFDTKQSLKIFPIAKSTEVMMLNKTDWDKFSQSTGVQLGDLKTMEGVVAAAEKYYNWTDSLTQTPGDGKAFFGRDAVANYFIIGCKQLGVEIFSVKDGKMTLNAEKNVMKKLWDNFYTPYINGYFGAYGKFRSDDAKTGELIAVLCSTSGAAYFPSRVMVDDTNSYDIETVVMQPPCFQGGEPYAVQQGAGMVVTKSDSQKEYAATVFLKWFTDAQRNIDFAASSGYLPVKKDANQSDKILATLNKEQESTIVNNLKLTVPVAMQVISDNTLYTNKAFLGGTKARAVLENFMMDKANADRKKVVDSIASGASLAEAAAPFLTVENFDTWYDSFVKALNAAVE